MQDYPSSATLDELRVNRCLCWMYAFFWGSRACASLGRVPVHVLLFVFGCMRIALHLHAIWSALTSLQGSLRRLEVRLCGRSGVKPGQRAGVGCPAAAHREASVLLLLPPSDQPHECFSFSHSTKHQCLVSPPKQPCHSLLFPL